MEAITEPAMVRLYTNTSNRGLVVQLVTAFCKRLLHSSHTDLQFVPVPVPVKGELLPDFLKGVALPDAVKKRVVTEPQIIKPTLLKRFIKIVDKAVIFKGSIASADIIGMPGMIIIHKLQPGLDGILQHVPALFVISKMQRNQSGIHLVGS